MPGAPPTMLLLQYPLARALAAYRPLQIAIAVLSLLGLAIVVMATWRMAQSITRPISALDDAARRIVQMASPYAAFPDAIRRDTDVLEITRTWTFTNADRLRSD